ncbi:MAG: YobA family protein [Actinomycetota bacterium]|nr:YobA family protein [Actinomycetota bacterium]
MTKLIKGRMSRMEKARGRDALLVVSLALVCFVLSGCADPKPGTTASGEEPSLPSAEADIRGIITEVGKTRQETNGGGSAGERIGVVLVEENPEEETGCQKDSVTVTKATKLLERRGGDLTRIGFDDLKAGQRVRAWYTGPVAESYPRQATASLIVVYLPAE